MLLLHCQINWSWWRHRMETFSALLAICAGNSPVTSEFPVQRPVTQSFDIFFDLHLNKGLSKQSWGWWFETPLHSLWRHCKMYNEYVQEIHLFWWFIASYMASFNSWWPRDLHMVTLMWVNIGSVNGLLPDGTNPLPEPIVVTTVTSCELSVSRHLMDWVKTGTCHTPLTKGASYRRGWHLSRSTDQGCQLQKSRSLR